MTPETLPAVRLHVDDDVAAFSLDACARGWTDGLPVIPPTPARVQRLLASVPRHPLDVLGQLPPRRGVATVEAVAVNAVMAGCDPEHFPVLVAAVEAVARPAFNLESVNATTHPAALFVLVSPAAARAAGVHGGTGCFGPGFRANAAIGRALRLVQINIAGAHPGNGDASTAGTPAKFTFCATEREDASPFPLYHTTRGLDPGAFAVTVFPGEGPHNIQDHFSLSGEGLLRTISGAMGQAGSNNILGLGEPILALGPEHAATLAADGYTRESIQSYLFEHARYPADRLDPVFVDQVWMHTRQREALLPIAERPDTIHVFVAGGAGRHSAWIPTVSRAMRPVTVSWTT